jgi:hypothetical protein
MPDPPLARGLKTRPSSPSWIGTWVALGALMSPMTCCADTILAQKEWDR